jgi:thermitase
MRIVLRRSSLALLAAVAAAFAAPSAAFAAEGQIIVKYNAGADAHDRADARADADVVARGALPLARTEVVAPKAGTTVSEAIAGLEASPDVAYAEPNVRRSAFDDAAPAPTEPGTTEPGTTEPGTTEPGSTDPGTPPAPTPPRNPDVYLKYQWALKNTGQQIFWGSGPRDWYLGTTGDDINAEAAWQLGTEAVPTVAVVDSGVDLGHPDLAPNLLAGGKDFIDGDDAPQDQNGHGTHVAGTIGAVGNNGTGVTGVAWKAHILPVRVLDKDGSGDVVTVIAGEKYATDHGAKIVNLSLGGASPSQAEYDALRSAAGTLFVVAAGNDRADVDHTDSYPCAYDLPNVVCVAATGGHDELASFSNYGASTVDLAAPGVDILSTYPRGTGDQGLADYEWLSGTSMATPEVAGAAALMLSADGSLTPWQVRAKLMAGVDPVPALAGKVASGGRLDVYNALNAAAPPADTAPKAAALAPAARGKAPAPSAPATPATPSVPSTPPAATTPKPATPAPATPLRTSDTTAPSIAAVVGGRHTLKLLLAGRLKASATTSERATVRFELRVDGRTAKKLKLAKSAAKPVRVATGSATLTAAGTKAGTLKLTRAAKRALGRVRSVKVTLRATATDAAGNARTRSRTVTITR